MKICIKGYYPSENFKRIIGLFRTHHHRQSMASQYMTRSPISELWKRRLVFISILFTILTLIGIVMVAVECAKLQNDVLVATTIIGSVLYCLGVSATYLILWVSALTKKEYPTSPVVASCSVLHILTGSSLICVAYILPADFMYYFAFPQNSGGEVVDGESVNFGNMHEFSVTSGKEIVHLIRTRLVVLGFVVAGVGFIGGLVSLIVVYTIHKELTRRKEAELERRRKSRRHLDNSMSKQYTKRRGSVYDYAGWANRTKDIFHEDPEDREIPPPTREAGFSQTPSIISTTALNEGIADIRGDSFVESKDEIKPIVTSFSMASTVLRNDDVSSKYQTKSNINWSHGNHKSSVSMDITTKKTKSLKKLRKDFYPTEAYSMDEIYKVKSQPSGEDKTSASESINLDVPE